jgi:hypothetical protein
LGDEANSEEFEDVMMEVAELSASGSIERGAR